MKELVAAAVTAALGLAFSAPAGAQPMGGMPMDMPGMKMAGPTKKPAKAPKRGAGSTRSKSTKPARGQPVADPRRSTDHRAMPGMNMSGERRTAPGAGQPSMAGMQMPTGQQGGASESGVDHSAMPGMNMPGGSPMSSQAGQSAMAGMRMPAGQQGGASSSGMDHSAMPGMAMSASGQPGAQTAQPSMPGMQMPAGTQGGAMAGMAGMAIDGAAQTGTSLPAGNDPPPPVPKDHAADRVYDLAAMQEGRHHFYNMHGGETYSQALLNLGEYQFRKGGDGYRWDGEAWYGGDINRLWFKSEGEGATRGGLDSAELQALYSRAIGPYFNLQTGVRQDFSPRGRTYLTIGTEGLAPSFFEVESALFLSTQGEVLGRVEGWSDFRVTERLILQPRVELNLAAQDTRETRTGAGLSQAELGLRLRYEFRREFAPYIGVSYERRFGRTADYSRAVGEDVYATSFVLGVRAWF